MTLNECKLATSCSPEFESIPWLLTRDETPLGKQRTSQTSPSPEHYSSPAYRERIDLAAQEGRAEDAAGCKSRRESISWVSCALLLVGGNKNNWRGQDHNNMTSFITDKIIITTIIHNNNNSTSYYTRSMCKTHLY